MPSLPHLTHQPENEQEWFQALIDLARYLRTPEGCPWDREQDARSFAGYLDGEMKELIEAFDTNDEHLEEEYGDCIFTLLASVAAAEEAGRVRLDRILIGIHEKMIRRHEHVFGENKATSSQDAIDSWNRIKAQEKAAKLGQ
jgi:tetrapyrrole methylase family protein/MazG family protein